MLDGVRRASIDAYAPAGHDDAGALLGGLVLGADEDLSRAARDDFRASGLAHLLAVSGSNVALLVVLVLVLAWVAGLGRAPAVGATILVIAGYVGVVGPSPSVVRAGVAGALAAAAWLLSRPVDRWHLFAVGLAVLLARNPWDALEPGFQLSFAAVAAIYVLAPRLTGWLEGTPLPLILVVPVSISAACTLVTAPIAYVHFGQANVVALGAGERAGSALGPADPLARRAGGRPRSGPAGGGGRLCGAGPLPVPVPAGGRAARRVAGREAGAARCRWCWRRGGAWAAAGRRREAA